MSRWSQRGFTLVELIIVIAISGLLLAAALAGQGALRNNTAATLAIDKVYNQVRDVENSAQTAINAVGVGNTGAQVYGTMAIFNHTNRTQMTTYTLIADGNDPNDSSLLMCNKSVHTIVNGMQYKDTDDPNNDAAIVYRTKPQHVYVAKGSIGAAGTTYTLDDSGADQLKHIVTSADGDCTGAAYDVSVTDPSAGNPVDNCSGAGGASNPQCDNDGDGVVNGDEDPSCLTTPAGTPVDAHGCPLTVVTPVDTDGDGIVDTTDKCRTTPDANSTGVVAQIPRNGCPVKWAQGLRTSFFNNSNWTNFSTNPASAVDIHSTILPGDYNSADSTEDLIAPVNPGNSSGVGQNGAVDFLKKYVGVTSANNTGMMLSGQIYIDNQPSGLTQLCLYSNGDSSITIDGTLLSGSASGSIACGTKVYSVGWHTVKILYRHIDGVAHMGLLDLFKAYGAGGGGAGGLFVPAGYFRHPEEATILGNAGNCTTTGNHCTKSGTSIGTTCSGIPSNCSTNVNASVNAQTPCTNAFGQEAMHFVKTGLTPGADYKIDLEYFNDHPTYTPPPGYKYNLCVYQDNRPLSTLPVQLHANTTTPKGRAGEKLPFTVTIPPDGHLNLSYSWGNDYCTCAIAGYNGTAYDANFGINQFEIYADYGTILNAVAGSPIAQQTPAHAHVASAPQRSLWNTIIPYSAVESVTSQMSHWVQHLIAQHTPTAHAAGSTNLLDRSSYESGSSNLTLKQDLHFTDDSGHNGTITVDPVNNTITRSFSNE